MGIVNATPDSFSDGGLHPTTEARVELALDLVAEGAAIVDVGGQSGITGVPEVPVDEEIARVVPTVAAIHEAAPDVVISVDTYRPAVAEAVLAAGAAIVNDVSGLLYPEVADLCGSAGAGLVIMHTRARPKRKVLDPELYDDVTDDVVAFLSSQIDLAAARGGWRCPARTSSAPSPAARPGPVWGARWPPSGRWPVRARSCGCTTSTRCGTTWRSPRCSTAGPRSRPRPASRTGCAGTGKAFCPRSPA